MNFIFTTFLFVLGLIVGSFLNVIILRYHTKKIFKGRSMCMVCQKKLSWYELFPFFSFIFLKGRCKGCKTRISLQYPIVELLTGLIFLGIFLKFHNIFYLDFTAFVLTFVYYATIFSILIIISVYDIKHKIIPDMLALILGVLSFVGLFFFSGYGFKPHIPSVWEFMSGLVVSVPFAFLWLVSGGRWMGLGDAKLAVGLGWIVGIPRIFSAAVISFWAGALMGLFMIFFSKKYSIKSEMPFAPFLIIGILLSFIFEIHLF